MHRIGSVAFLTLALAIGCGARPSLPPLHPVKGQVVNHGVPVKGGSVAFSRLNDQASLIVNGLVDDSGRFELATLQDRTRHPGAPAGEYRVLYIPPVVGKDAFPTTLAKSIEIAAKTNEVVIDLADRE